MTVTLHPQNTPPPSHDDAEARLFARLLTLGLPFQVAEHQATHTVSDGQATKQHLPGGHTKSLLLTNKKGQLWLIVAAAETRADLKGLAARLDSGRLSFAKEEQMIDTLGVRPGTLSPLALLNDRDRHISMVIVDETLSAHERIWCHPLRNTASVSLSPDDLVTFIKSEHSAPALYPLTENGSENG